MYLYFRIFGCLLFLQSTCLAQLSSPAFHHLSLESGLSQANNYFVFKDSRGFVWISSTAGLNRYDGRQIRVYQPDPADSTSLLGNNIQSIFFEDRQGDLWFSTFEAVNCYVRKDDCFRRFFLRQENGQPRPGYFVAGLDGEENLWVIVQPDELYLLDTKTGKFQYRHKLCPQVQRGRLVLDESGRVESLLAYSFNLPGLQINTYQPEFAQRILFDGKDGKLALHFQDVRQDKSGTFWLSTKQGLGAFRMNPDTLTLYNHPEKGAVGNISNMVVFGEEQLLLSTLDSGLAVFDKKLERFTQQFWHEPANPRSLSGDALGNIVGDGDGNFWITVSNVGVDFFNWKKKKFENILGSENKEGLPALSYKSIIEDEKGNFFCLTDGNGIVLLNPERQFIRLIAKKEDLPSNNIFQLFQDKKHRIWALTWGGLARWSAQKERFEKVSDDIFLHALQLGNGEIFFAPLQGGVVRAVENPAGNFHFEKVQGIDASEPYVVLFEDSCGRLFGNKNAVSLCIFEPGPIWRLAQDLPIGGQMNAFYEDAAAEVLWIATIQGLVRLDLKTKKPRRFTEKDGLPSQTVYTVLPDRLGFFWLSTNKGVSRFDPKREAFQNFTLADGISSLEFNTFGYLQRENGEIWLGSQRGITTFHPDHIRLIDSPARPMITAILVNDEAPANLRCARTEASNVNEMQSIECDWKDNTLSFEFAALEYSDPLQTRFRYQMEGLDERPVEAGTKNFVRYANLPHGRYTFLLWAANSDAVWNETPRRLEIFIRPPFWQTWWFLLLAIIAFGGAIWGGISTYFRRKERIFQLKIENRLALERERNRIAAEMHDDLGSGLAKIKFLSEALKLPNGNGPSDKIVASATELLERMNEIIWAMSQKNDSLENLVAYCRGYTMEFCEASHIKCRFDLPLEVPDQFISGEARRNIFLILKESLHNTVKHANATQFTVAIQFNDFLEMTILDNGIGFHPTNTAWKGGNGILNMRRRAESIKGELSIANEAGTLVRLRVPLSDG